MLMLIISLHCLELKLIREELLEEKGTESLDDNNNKVVEKHKKGMKKKSVDIDHNYCLPLSSEPKIKKCDNCPYTSKNNYHIKKTHAR